MHKDKDLKFLNAQIFMGISGKLTIAYVTLFNIRPTMLPTSTNCKCLVRIK